jgi:hypothetical protein
MVIEKIFVVHTDPFVLAADLDSSTLLFVVTMTTLMLLLLLLRLIMM